jgi:hypothetical protein
LTRLDVERCYHDGPVANLIRGAMPTSVLPGIGTTRCRYRSPAVDRADHRQQSQAEASRRGCADQFIQLTVVVNGLAKPRMAQRSSALTHLFARRRFDRRD